MTVTVNYRIERPYGTLRPGEPLRPYLPVSLHFGSVAIDTRALIDSGADYTLFHVEFADALGLERDPARARTTTGVGGVAHTWYFDLHLEVLGRRMPARVGFSSGAFREFALLGRHDFFAAFHVGFDERRKRVLLQPVI